MPFRESSPNCVIQTLFRCTFSEKIPRTTFQGAFPMRFLETRPPKAFPEGFLYTLSQKGFCESLSQGPAPRHFSREPFLRRLPKTFPERLPSPALPETRFFDALPRTRKGDAPCGHPLAVVLYQHGDRTPGTYLREERDRRMPGEGGTPFSKGVPPSPGPPSSLPKLFILGNTATGRPGNVKLSRGKTPLPSDALLIPPSGFSRRFTAGRQGSFFKTFSESLP